MSEILEAARRHRREVLAMERQASVRMVNAYGQSWQRIKAGLDQLTARIEAARAAGVDLAQHPAWLYQQERYQALLRQTTAEMTRFAGYAEGEITAAQREAVRQAERAAEELTRAAQGPPPPGYIPTAAAWTRLPADRVETMVGFLGDGSPLSDLLGELGPAAKAGVERALIAGVATGQNPRVIAGQVRREMGGNLTRALTISRTECLPGETIVDAAVIRAIYRRWYEGPMVEVITKSGRRFSATPNHPVLTSRGWLASGEIVPGDDLICHTGKQHMCPSRNEDIEARPTTIREIFDTLSAIGICQRRQGGNPDFHGDGMEGNIDVACPFGSLSIGTFTPLYEPVINSFLSPADWARAPICPQCGRLLSIDKQPCLCIGADGSCSFQETVPYATAGYTEAKANGGLCLPGEVTLGHGCKINAGMKAAVSPSLGFHSGFYGVISAGTCYSGLPEHVSYARLDGSEHRGDFLHGEAGLIELDNVIFVSLRAWSGHVYNLSTPFGYFISSQLYTGNTMRVHREASLASYRANSDVVKGWVWLSSMDERACAACIAMNGTEHSLDETLDEHPNGVCVASPITRSWEELGFPGIEEAPVVIESGEAQFARWPEEKQLKVLGQAKFDAYRSGQINLSNLVGRSRSRAWGTTRREASLANALENAGGQG